MTPLHIEVAENMVNVTGRNSTVLTVENVASTSLRILETASALPVGFGTVLAGTNR